MKIKYIPPHHHREYVSGTSQASFSCHVILGKKMYTILDKKIYRKSYTCQVIHIYTDPLYRQNAGINAPEAMYFCILLSCERTIARYFGFMDLFLFVLNNTEHTLKIECRDQVQNNTQDVSNVIC